MLTEYLGMAAEIDCFQDDWSEEEGHWESSVADVEWRKLKSSRVKDGFRDGYSVGEESTLQQAFNKGFVQQVRIQTNISFYNGILMVLKNFISRSEHSDSLHPRQTGDIARIEAILAELESTSGPGCSGPTQAVMNVELSKPVLEKIKLSHGTEGVSPVKPTACSSVTCNNLHEKSCSCEGTHPTGSMEETGDRLAYLEPSGAHRLSGNSEGVTLENRLPPMTDIFSVNDHNLLAAEDVNIICCQFLKEFGFTEMLEKYFRVL